MPHEKPTKAHRRLISITVRVPQAVVDMVDEAALALGSDRTELVIAAIRDSVSKVVRKTNRKRTDAVEQFLKKYPPGTDEADAEDAIPKQNKKTG